MIKLVIRIRYITWTAPNCLTRLPGWPEGGKVYQAYFNKKNNSNNNNNNNKLAIKIIPLSKDTESKNYLRSYVAEQNVKNLKHPNLIAQLGAQQFDKMSSNAFIIYEYGGRMNLNQFIFNTDLSLHIGQRKHFCIDLVRIVWKFSVLFWSQ